MNAKCKKCGMNIKVGYNGVVADPNSDDHLCDGCAGVTRDLRGNVVTPEDRERGYSVYQSVATGRIRKRSWR